MVICVWNTSHLLKRSVETYLQQDFPYNFWELIVVNDNSFDNVRETIQPLFGEINIRYIELKHDYGMRGNTVAFNTGYAWANGEILMESTPEIMLPDDCITKLYAPHLKNKRCFVAMKTYNLTPELQLEIDSVDWKSDLGNVMKLPNFFNDWTLNNYKNCRFGTHQLSSIHKNTFYELMPNGFPLFADYGSDDPYFCNKRETNNVNDITIMQPLAIHQWHPPYAYWQAMGYSKNTNKFGHTTINFMEDSSGQVPSLGTRFIWDGGNDEWFSEDEITNLRKLDNYVIGSGCKVEQKK